MTYTEEDQENDRKEYGYPRVVTVYAQPAGGPGWSNVPLYIVMEDLDRTARGGKRLYIECIQPKYHTSLIRALYAISSILHDQLTDEVEKIMKKKWRD
jgi:hypothetical protein